MYVKKQPVPFLNKDFLIVLKRNGYNLRRIDTIHMSQAFLNKLLRTDA